MSQPESGTAGAAIESYLDRSRLPYAFCGGCSHAMVVDKLDAALVSLQLDPRQVVVVTDIGCAGIADQYLRTHAFHGLHGRSLTYATGIKLANPELHVIVLTGDGGCGIGGHHLLGAARRNIGITVLVFDNFNFGMTGGQFSVTTPAGGRTATTPLGNLERPIDIAGTVALNGASFVARTTAFDPRLPDLIAAAIQTDGFALLDVWELCVAYYVPQNEMNRRRLGEALAAAGGTNGVVHTESRPEYARAYRAAHADLAGIAALPPRPLEPIFSSGLGRPVRLALAGAAGQRVRSAGNLLATGGVLSGLWAASRDDYPITVRTGYSLAEVVLSPTPVLYTGMDKPEAVALIAPEGAGRLRSLLAGLDEASTVFRSDGVGPIATGARVVGLDFPPAAQAHARRSLSMLAVARLVQALELFPLDALREAVRLTQRSEIAAENLAAIDAVAGES